MNKGGIFLRFLSIITTFSLLQVVFLSSFIPPVRADLDVGAHFLDGFGDPITTSLDLRVSLWDANDVRSGDINGDGSLNTSALHYGQYQTTFTITPDGQGYFSPGILGLYRFSLGSLASFPQLSPFNAFLQLEYKSQGAPDTDYIMYDFVDDPPFQNVTRMLLDSNAAYYVNDAGPRTNWNTFTLDANNNAPTAVTLEFGETLAKTLAYTIATGKFDLNDDLNVGGGLTATGTIDFSAGGSISGAAINLNVSSNFDVNLATGTSTGVVNIGNTSGGVVIGGGTAIKKHLSATASLNFGATAAASCDALTVTVTGAVDGDTVEIGLPAALGTSDANQIFYGYVSATNTVTVKRCNIQTLTALSNPAAATVRVDVWQH